MVKTVLEKRQGRAGLLALAGSLVLGLTAGSLVRWGAEGLPPAVTFVGLMAAFAVGIAATLPWWRSLDPMQREAQYFAWHWGGVVGLSVAFAVFIAFSGMESELFRGALLLGVAQIAGYSLLWAIWVLRHRGEAA